MSFWNTLDKTIEEWRTSFIKNDFFPRFCSRKLPKIRCPLSNEELNKKAREFVEANASVKGKKDLTAAAFCHWINEVLLHNSVLEPGFPRRVALTTALRWLHNLGFQVIKKERYVR